MNCPKCGKEMLRGTMHTSKYPFWAQQELRFFKSPTDTIEPGSHGDDTASVFTRDLFPTFPATMLCKDCGRVVFS